QRDELAKLAGLTPRRLNQLAQENKIPAPVKGQFPTRETLTALFNYFRNRKEAESITEARLRRQIAQADMAELDLAERREALLPAENIE
ncbi:MAG TPA: hypothetical protein PKV85_04410, partial [Spirochaetota bacterium]|nr:hypothetical protein [Spirochaetota bacterium]